jgi:S-formylglutathione hydrolase FrmB
MKFFKTAFLLYALLGFITVKAAIVDTALTYSAAMHKNIKAIVIRPDNYSDSKKYPVLYLLHGYSGNYSDWITKVTAVKELSDQYHVIIVCPDGNFSSWYFDSPVNPEWRYETYVSTELVNWIDSHFSTIKNRTGRAITGLSMGGHGALFIAFKHQDLFGAAGSMSGGVDMRAFPGSFGIEKVLGKYKEYPDRWEKNSVVNLVHLLKPNSLSVMVDCGYDDKIMYKSNLQLHEKLMEYGIPHDFIIRPGAHTWEYWSNSINYQMLFFDRFFTQAN